MRKAFLPHLLAIATTLAAATASATDWQTTTDIVWAGRHYRECKGLASGYSESDNAISWNFEADAKMIFALHIPDGHVRADVVMTPVANKTVTLNVRIVHPKTGTVIIEQTVETQKGRNGKQEVEILPDTEMPADGWYFIEFTSPNAKENLNTMESLRFQRTSNKAVTAANSMMAPAVHLWWTSTDPKAPDGDSFDWVYMEALIPEAYKQSCTYQMTIGSTGLYSGIQTNHLLDDDSWTHAVIFSAWDAGDTDKDKSLPDYMRSGALDEGEGAYAVRFGGEGTGASLRYPEGQRWQTDHWVQMLMYERPDYIERETTDDQGNTVVKPFRSTLLSYWYKQAEETEWHYFGTLRAAGTYRMEGKSSGLYSFLENWSGFGGDRYRRVYYRNGAMRSTASGKWYSLNKAGFGSTQHWQTQRNSRDDYGHGVTDAYDNSFYIEAGGLLGVRDSADSYAPVPQGQMPWVDTINIQALRDRIDMAVLHGNTRDVNMRIEATSVISDTETWKLIGYSDEEVNEEGEYGRAAQILDGNTSSYYRQKAYSTYPHSFSFDAGTTVTVRSIGLYQGFDLNYRARQAQLSYSDDGKSYKSAGTINFDNDATPTAVLAAPITARYFNIRFTRGHGAGRNLAINEIYFKNEYRLDDLKTLAAELLEEQDRFSGFKGADLDGLREVYADGSCTDTEALVQAIRQLGQTAHPLSLGNVDKESHITSFTAYQLHNPYGYGDLVVNDKGEIAIAGATTEGALDAYRRPTRVSAASDNWLVLRSETYTEYYIYNLGAKKYLNISADGITLSDTPVAFDLSWRNEGFTIGVNRARLQLRPKDTTPAIRTARVDDACVLQLRNNYALSPADKNVRKLLEQSEIALHGEPDAIGGISEEARTTPDALSANDLVSIVNAQGLTIYHGPYSGCPQLPRGIYIITSEKGTVKKICK